MGRSCSICALPLAGAIDERLRSGESARAVAAECSVSYDALTRHHRNHVSRVAPVLPEAPDDPLAELVVALRQRALAGNTAATREYRLALAAQTDARHARPPERDLADEPEWHVLRIRLLEALEPYAEACLAVVAALGEL